jgi:hypothetical protein
MRQLTFYLFLSYISVQSVRAQEPLIIYDENNPTARILYEGAHEPKKSEIQIPPQYPVEGNYTPTSYSNGPLGIDPNRGFCDYVYVPTEGKLKPGTQYTLKLRMKFDENYDQMSFYQDHFGIALTSFLYPNRFPSHWGLWRHTNESLGVFQGDEIITIEKEFRPLCTSKFLVLGVFRAGEMDHLSCFFCYYPFEIYELTVTESADPSKPSRYFGDEFKQEAPTNFSKREYNVFFDSGSSKIGSSNLIMLDSLASNLKTTQDIILLSAYTDMSGNDNVRLGAARNNAVHKALTNRGIEKSRITYYNFADSEAAEVIVSTDRRVEINLIKGNLFRKHYSDAIESAKAGDYPTAYKTMTNEWLKAIPPKKALLAVSDCWGEGKKADFFKGQLLGAIKTKVYGKHALRFKLDSLRMEWLKGRGLYAHQSLLRMPGTQHDCNFRIDKSRDAALRKEADSIFERHGFPIRDEVGIRAAEVLPELIFTSDDVPYLEKYLPLFKSACEERKLKWEFYARLYDKISIAKFGFQRYGTKMQRGKNGKLTPSFPFEDPEMVDEYRRRVKLAPFTKSMNNDFQAKQENLDADLVKMLNNIYKADQHLRNTINENRHRGFQRMKSIDSLNQIKIKRILDERGWLGPEIIGERGTETLFLVIQHADLDYQLQYLPMMREAVINGNAKGSNLALLEDRVALGQGKKQIYGSQIHRNAETGEYYVAPLENPEEVNLRRAEVGLGRIEDYVKRWNIVWDER